MKLTKLKLSISNNWQSLIHTCSFAVAAAMDKGPLFKFSKNSSSLMKKGGDYCSSQKQEFNGMRG